MGLGGLTYGRPDEGTHWDVKSDPQPLSRSLSLPLSFALPSLQLPSSPLSPRQSVLESQKQSDPAAHPHSNTSLAAAENTHSQTAMGKLQLTKT